MVGRSTSAAVMSFLANGLAIARALGPRIDPRSRHCAHLSPMCPSCRDRDASTLICRLSSPGRSSRSRPPHCWHPSSPLSANTRTPGASSRVMTEATSSRRWDTRSATVMTKVAMDGDARAAARGVLRVIKALQGGGKYSVLAPGGPDGPAFEPKRGATFVAENEEGPGGCPRRASLWSLIRGEHSRAAAAAELVSTIQASRSPLRSRRRPSSRTRACRRSERSR